nr:retinitis pigmentosa 9 protein isoform X1 [Dasypus novemcinctus]
MKNLLPDLSRKMKLSQKTVYQMYQAMNMPGNFWLMRQLKDFGCHWGKKSKLCSAPGTKPGTTRGRRTLNCLNHICSPLCISNKLPHGADFFCSMDHTLSNQEHPGFISWRCKRYGHRTGDKECPFFIKGNQKLEQFRVAHEDPMYDIIRENKRHEKDVRIQQLKQLLEDSSSDEDDSSSSSSEDKEKHKKKKKKEKHKKRKKEKKKKKKRKHKSSKSNESSDSD